MRRADRYLLLLGILLCGFLLMFAHARFARSRGIEAAGLRSLYVRNLGLTDLCLFTEARYTRHPALADLHAAFQDHPASLEHFPSGAILLPCRPSSESDRPMP